jgi:hypothetical protein
MQKIDPKPRLIDRCYDCSEYSSYLDNCLIKRMEVENCNIIPEWCPLEDYKE